MTADLPSTYNVLFVCTGNTCRSPMAEAVARRSIAERGWSHVRVRSAGVAAHDGEGISSGSAEALEKAGIPLEGHSATLVDGALIEWADLILTMGTSHLAVLEQMGAGTKAALITDFAEGGQGSSRSIPDPFGASIAVYQATLQTIEDLVEDALDRLAPIIQP